MFCRNCGTEVNKKTVACLKCGVPPLLEKKFCQECGAETKENQMICINCGANLFKVHSNKRAIDFEIGKWLIKNKKIIIGIIGACIILLAIWFFFLRHTPSNDGQKASTSLCKCYDEYEMEIIKINRDFLKSYEKYKIRDLDNTKIILKGLYTPAISKYNACTDKAKDQYNIFRDRYLSDDKKLNEFDYSYNEHQKIFSKTDPSKFVPFYFDINNTAAQIFFGREFGEMLGSWSYLIKDYNDFITIAPNLSGMYHEEQSTAKTIEHKIQIKFVQYLWPEQRNFFIWTEFINNTLIGSSTFEYNGGTKSFTINNTGVGVVEVNYPQHNKLIFLNHEYKRVE